MSKDTVHYSHLVLEWIDGVKHTYQRRNIITTMPVSVSFTAQELLDALHDLDEQMYDRVFDIISDRFTHASGTWERDDDGNMIMLVDE